MSPPTECFKKLSLESMPPTTRLQSRLQHAEVEVEDTDSTSSSDPGSEPDFDIDEDEDVMVSPSRLKYSLDLLDDETRDNVIRATEVPSQFVLRGCQGGEQRCLFLITEPVEYTVRTGSEESGYGIPSCTCESGDSPCRHVLWLFDQITNQVLGARGSPYTLTQHGYPAELGNPYDAISDFHLDMLADSLHCDVVGQSADPNPRRVRETREILASLNDVPTEEYRPDLFGDSDNHPRRLKGKRAVARGDLEQTVFRMLLRNDDFFTYFLSSVSLRADERNEVRFSGLRLRADAALAGLREYADHPALQQVAKPKDVEWCAAHLETVARQIRAVIHTTDRPLEPRELRAAARTAVHVLERVVFDFDRDVGPADLPADQRNLYRRLIGTNDDDDNDNSNFVIDVLDSVPPEVLGPWIDDLAAVERRIAEKRAPATYLARLRSLLGHLRERWGGGGGATTAVAGSKRSSGGGQSQSQHQRVKRAR
ncbi:hypothetical protein Hte_000216 [Hypoxylon texense]